MHKVIRGGSWIDFDIDARSASRCRTTQADKKSDLSFRLVLNIPAYGDFAKQCNWRSLDLRLFSNLLRMRKMNPLDDQIGGSHYLRLAEYQPWKVLEHWYNAGRLQGNVAFLAGEALVYLARFITCAPGKGGIEDVQKASHTLRRLLQVMEENQPAILDGPPQEKAMYYPYKGATGQPCTVQFTSIPPGRSFIRPRAGGGFWVDDVELVIGADNES